jgi:hypothetical protein
MVNGSSERRICGLTYQLNAFRFCCLLFKSPPELECEHRPLLQEDADAMLRSCAQNAVSYNTGDDVRRFVIISSRTGHDCCCNPYCFLISVTYIPSLYWTIKLFWHSYVRVTCLPSYINERKCFYSAVWHLVTVCACVQGVIPSPLPYNTAVTAVTAFNIHKLCILLTQPIFVYRMIFTMKSDQLEQNQVTNTIYKNLRRCRSVTCCTDLNAGNFSGPWGSADVIVDPALHSEGLGNVTIINIVNATSEY